MNTIQQSAVFHLTKCQNSTLYKLLQFILLLIIFKECSNNRDLILRTFFYLCLNGFFLEIKLVIKNGHDFCVSRYMFSFISFEIFFAFKLLLILCGNFEVKLVPSYWTSLSFRHWNLSSISAQDFGKISLLEVYNTIPKFDIICLSEIFLNSSLQNDDGSLVLNGYKLIKVDNPNDLTRGGISIYFKQSLSIKVIIISKLNECVVCELS